MISHEFYNSELLNLLADPKYNEKYVAIIGTKIVDYEVNEGDLVLRVEKNYVRIPTLVAHVTTIEDVEELDEDYDLD